MKWLLQGAPIFIKRSFFLVIIALAVMASTAHAATLDEFKTAQANMKAGGGCNTIPYSNYRSKCEDQGKIRDDFCKKENNGCAGLETKGLIEVIKGIEAKISALKQEKDNASTDAEKQKIADQISELSTKLDDRKEALSTDLGKIDTRLTNGHKCLEARLAIQEVFKSAIDDAEHEGDPEIKAIAKELIEYWKKTGEEHKDAIVNAETAIKNCEACRNGDI